MTLTVRKPTGLPAWPVLLLAGVEKSGKTYAAAQASASDMIGHTYWIGFGEQDPDEYGQIGRFDIVEHDGTYRDLLRAIDDVKAAVSGDKPTLLVLDSASKVWQLLKDETQEAAWRRAKRNAEKYRKPFSQAVEEVKPSMDLWNLAAQRWGHIMAALQAHPGPVIITARMDEVAVIGSDDKPTRDKEWSIQGHKSLPFEVSGIVELRSYRKASIRGVRSLRWQAPPDQLVPVPDFTVEGLWQKIGLADATAGVQRASSAEASLDADQPAPADDELTAVKRQIAKFVPEGAQVARWANSLFTERGMDINSVEDARAVLAYISKETPHEQQG